MSTSALWVRTVPGNTVQKLSYHWQSNVSSSGSDLKTQASDSFTDIHLLEWYTFVWMIYIRSCLNNFFLKGKHNFSAFPKYSKRLVVYQKTFKKKKKVWCVHYIF